MINDNLFTEELARDRLLVLTGRYSSGLHEDDADALIKALAWLDRQGHDDIILVCQSVSGGFDAMIAIHDMMQAVESDIRTISVGTNHSSGAIISCAGTKGKRHCFPNSMFVMQEIKWAMDGFYSENLDRMEAFDEIQSTSCSIIAQHTGRSADEVKEHLASRHEIHMTAQGAQEWRLVDSIVGKWGEWENSQC